MAAAPERALRIEVESVRERFWATPPPDQRVPTIPPGARGRVAGEIADHLRRELTDGRSLYRVVRDPFIEARVSEFDGRALVNPRTEENEA